MKYLITGVAGFVGRYFVEYLQNNEPEAEILGVDIAPSCELPLQKYVSLDLVDNVATAEIMKHFAPDYVVHLASISSVGQSWQMPAE